jgi:hypothetical protein
LWCRKKTWIFSTNLQSIFPDSSVIRSFSVYFLCFTHSLPVRRKGGVGEEFQKYWGKLATGTFLAYYRKFIEGAFPDTEWGRGHICFLSSGGLIFFSSKFF